MLALLYWWRRRRNRLQRFRNYYVRPAHLNQIDMSFELFERYYQSEDPNELQNFCRFTPQTFDELYGYVEGRISNHRLTHRRPITGRQRLVVFLRYVFRFDLIEIKLFRYITQGLSMKATAQEFRIGHQTVNSIVYEVCTAVCETMHREWLPLPKRQTWLDNAGGFEAIWFPRAVAAMDGKHFEIKVSFSTS